MEEFPANEERPAAATAIFASSSGENGTFSVSAMAMLASGPVRTEDAT